MSTELRAALSEQEKPEMRTEIQANSLLAKEKLYVAVTYDLEMWVIE